MFGGGQPVLSITVLNQDYRENSNLLTWRNCATKFYLIYHTHRICCLPTTTFSCISTSSCVFNASKTTSMLKTPLMTSWPSVFFAKIVLILMVCISNNKVLFDLWYVHLNVKIDNFLNDPNIKLKYFSIQLHLICGFLRMFGQYATFNIKISFPSIFIKIAKIHIKFPLNKHPRATE